MNKTTKVWLVVLSIVAVITLLTAIGDKSLGSTNLTDLEVTSVAVGSGCGSDFTTCTGTTHDFVKSSASVNCNAPDVTLISGGTSTSTCSLTGVSSGDTVIASLPAGHVPGLRIATAFATTSDQIGVVLYNSTTTALTIGANSTSSLHVLILSR